MESQYHTVECTWIYYVKYIPDIVVGYNAVAKHPLFWIVTVRVRSCQEAAQVEMHLAKRRRRAIYFWYFFAAGFGIIFGFLVLCFPASLLFCFFACLLLCLSASLLYLLLFFSASLLSLLLCFSAFELLCLSTSTILPFLFFSHVFLLLYFLLLCFSASCLYCLFFFFFFSFALFSPVCKHPRWNPKKP